MSVLPLKNAKVEQLLLIITSLVTAWVLGTGIVLVFDAHDLSVQPQWQWAQFGGALSLSVYGAVFLLGGLLLFVDLLLTPNWHLRLIGGGLAGFVALFLTIGLVDEAVDTGLGWLGACSNLFVVAVLSVIIRYTLREHHRSQ